MSGMRDHKIVVRVSVSVLFLAAVGLIASLGVSFWRARTARDAPLSRTALEQRAEAPQSPAEVAAPAAPAEEAAAPGAEDAKFLVDLDDLLPELEVVLLQDLLSQGYWSQWPGEQRRLRKQIAILRKESVAESVANLAADVEMFFRPGGPERGFVVPGMPLAKSHKSLDVGSIMSNRRFLKVLQEVSSLGRKEAADLLSRQIRDSLEAYRAAFDADIERHPHYYGPGIKPTSGLSFKGSNNADGTPTLLGVRLQLLSLVLVAGNVGLEDAAPAVLSVVGEAQRQREMLYYDRAQFNERAAWGMLVDGSLYDRQILATGVLGTCVGGDEADRLLGQLGIGWEEKRLTHYDANGTPYDLPVRAGAIRPDYWKGELAVRFLGPVDDATFDTIVSRTELLANE